MRCEISIFKNLIKTASIAVVVLALVAGQSTSAAEKKSKGKKSFSDSSASSTTPTETTAEPQTEKSSRWSSDDSGGYGKTMGVAGPVTFGPYFGLNIPHPLNFGIEAKFKDIAGLSVGYGFMPERTYSSVKAKWDHWGVRARYFIFRRAFFAGIGAGKQEVEGNQTKTITISSVDYTVTAKVKVKATTLFPHVGWRWQWKSGFTLGVEVGAQFASGVSTTFETNITDATVLASDAYKDVKKKVEDTGNDYGNRTLPYLTLIQVGYMF